jgi:hypothetical protein
MIRVNGHTLPAVTFYTVGVMDIDGNTARTIDGTMVRDRIAVKRRVEVSWTVLTKEELSTILNRVSGVFFEVEYIDPQKGANRTGTFYVEDRTASGLDYMDGTIRWKDVQMNFVER